MKKVIRLLFCAGIIAMFALLVLTSSCNRTTTHKTRIGVILPMTGILAEMGQYEKQAMTLGVENLHNSGMNDIELVFEDGKGDNKAVAAAAAKLLDVDKAQMLITSTTGASLTAKPLAERHGVPLIAFCMGSDIAPGSNLTIRYYMGIEEESGAILKRLSTLPKGTRVGGLHASVAVWKTAVQALYQPFFSQHFTQPAVIEEYALNDKDFRPQITRFKNAGVQVLIVLGYGFEYEPIFTQMTELRLRENIHILGGWGFLYTPLSAQMLEGIEVAGPTYVMDRGSNGSDFEAAFTKAYGRQPNFDAAFAYEVVTRLPELLNLLKTTSQSGLKPALANKGTITGVVGQYHFTSDGNMIVGTGIGVFRNGHIMGQ
jgi:branched-chain amino acid transport system substrate-binding protein